MKHKKTVTVKTVKTVKKVNTVNPDTQYIGIEHITDLTNAHKEIDNLKKDIKLMWKIIECMNGELNNR